MCLYVCLLTFYMLGCLVPIALIMINAMAFSSSFYVKCKGTCDSSSGPLQLIILAIGVIMFFMSITFLIVIQCALGRYGTQAQGANQIGIMSPSSNFKTSTFNNRGF